MEYLACSAQSTKKLQDEGLQALLKSCRARLQDSAPLLLHSGYYKLCWLDHPQIGFKPHALHLLSQGGLVR